jgi:CRP/FNR family transcriptional regulator
MIRNSRRVAAGETFVSEGEAATHFFNITEGSVKVYKLMPDGRRQITGFLFAGDLLGLAVNDTYTYSAEALTPVTVCLFRRPQLERLLDDFPKMEKRLLAIASNELAAAQEQMMLLGRKTAQERIASFLLMLARREGRYGRSGDKLHLTMTRTDIGDYLGLTTETASRVFTSFRKRGWIELETATTWSSPTAIRSRSSPPAWSRLRPITPAARRVLQMRCRPRASRRARWAWRPPPRRKIASS